MRKESTVLIGLVIVMFSCQPRAERIVQNEEKSSTENVKASNKDQTEFVKVLEKGVFINGAYGVCYALDRNTLFLISKDEHLNERTMLHLLENEKTFKNLSFGNSKFGVQKDLILHNGYKVARIPLEDLDLYYAIRIGQYNASETEWRQLLFIDEVFNNPLLRYEGEPLIKFVDDKPGKE